MTRMEELQKYHTLDCVAHTVRLEQDRATWTAKWPDFCTSCEGAGAFHFNGNRDEPPSTEPCDECTWKGICPRCGEPGLTSEEGDGPCTFCAWNYDDSAPPFNDCPGCLPEEPFDFEGA